MAIASDRVLRALMPLAVAVVRPLLFLLERSWRKRWVVGEEILERLAGDGSPALYAFWHHGVCAAAFPVCRLQRARGVRLASLVSQSRDGDVVVRLAKPLKIELVRGSTSRGALSGLRKLRRLVAGQRFSVLTAPDGPRGPARAAQAGTVILAQTTGAVIVPFAAAANRAWHLRSWDRMVVPKPFARVALAVGEPRPVGRAADAYAESETLGRRLDELGALCERALGRPFAAREVG